MLQFSALLLLSVDEYSTFSGVYIGFALCWSLCLSLLGDPQLRAIVQYSEGDRTGPPDIADYRSALTQVALLSAALVSGLGIIIAAEAYAMLLAGLAVGLAIFRHGTRYTALAAGPGSKAALSELVGVLALGLCLVVTLRAWNAPIIALLCSWVVHSLVSSVGYDPRPLFARGGVVAWVAARRREVGGLLAESTLMDLSSIGLPFMIAPLGGTTTMATYRASVSALFPIRILINAARPRLVGSASRLTPKRHAFIVSASILTALAVGATLPLFQYIALQESSIILELLPFAPWIAIAAGATFAWNVYYLHARGRLEPKGLLSARLVQSITSIGGTLTAVVLYGQLGAVAAFAVTSLIAALIWALAASTHRLPNSLGGQR